MNLIILWLLLITFEKSVYCQKSPWNCEFREEKLGVTQDFSSIYNKEHDYLIPHKKKNETLRIQLCGPLIKNCNGTPGYGACLEIDNGIEKKLGRQPEYTNKDGRMIFKFTGEKCKDDFNYTLHVIMMCDYDSKIPRPELIPYGDSQCTFFITWRTILACARHINDPVTSVSCNIKDKDGNLYDLSLLKESARNYIISIDKNSSIILNVCHSVIYGYGAVCQDSVGACLRNHAESLSYKNIGKVNSLKLNGTSPVLDYDEGGLCATGQHKRTTISLICDHEANNTEPVFTGSDNDCHYKLSWKTPAACNVKDLQVYSRKSAAPCRITNPISKIEYNLNSLKGQDHIAHTKDGVGYKFSICGPIFSHNCLSQAKTGDANVAGVCSPNNYTSGGKYNTKLLWNVDGVYLNYTNGSPCNGNKRTTTIIKFVCAPEGLQNDKVINNDDPCNLLIHYHTPLVCEKKNILCSIGLELQEDGLCANQSLVSPSLPTIPTKTSVSIIQNSINMYSLIMTLLVVGICGILIAMYFRNSERREHLRSCCCFRYFRESDVRMQYSRINTGEETDALLDAPDTHCQSDSDDELLRI